MFNMSGDALSLVLAAVVLTASGASNYIQGETIDSQASSIEKLEKRVVMLEAVIQPSPSDPDTGSDNSIKQVMTDAEIQRLNS